MAWWDDLTPEYVDRAIGVAGQAANAVGNGFDAAGNFIGGLGEGDGGGGSSASPGLDPQELANRNPIPTGGATASNNTNSEAVQRIMSILGYSAVQASQLLAAANSGNANAQKALAQIGIEPFASQYAASGLSGSSGGGGGRALYPEEVAQIQAQTDEILANIGNINARTGQTNMQTRQIGALFDPNYADGALVPLPDGTMRINGTEIIIDPREKGQYKPVANAPGYFVDPITGQVIDTNGHQIERQQLQETIRSNHANEALSQAGINAQVENNRNRLALDTELGITGINLDAAKAENDFALRNGLGTNQLNLDSFLGTGNLNVNATNAETNRLSALTNRTASAGDLAARRQQLQDARTQNIIALSANPQNFVQREYETRALLAPPGYNGPAYKDDPALNQSINQLLTTPDVSGLLPTYTAPHFDPVALPNASLPRATAPVYNQLNTTANIPSAPLNDINNTPYTNTQVAPENQAASDAFRTQGVPDWALAPLGYAYGTQGTERDKFIVGDAQMAGEPNPEMVKVNNPGPDTTVDVVPLRNMLMSVLSKMGFGNADPLNGMFNPNVKLDTSQIDDKRNRKMERRLGQRQVGGPAFNPANLEAGLQSQSNELGKFNPINRISPTGIEPYRMGDEQLPSDMPLTGDVTMGREMNNPTPNAGMQEALNAVMQMFSKLPKFAYGTDYGSFANMFNNFNWDSFQNQYMNGGQDNGGQQAHIAPVNSSPLDNYSHPTSNPSTTTPYSGGGGSQQSSQYSNPYASQYGVDPALFGPRDSNGNYLGQLTANSNQAIQNMPNVRYLQNYANQVGFNKLGVGPVHAAFGVNLPDVGGINLRQLNDVAIDPDAWGTLSSLYSSGNRNLQAIYNRVLQNAPLGNAINSMSAIRTR